MKYDPQAFKAYQDKRLGRNAGAKISKPGELTTVEQVMEAIRLQGFALIPARERNTLRMRAHRKRLHFRFRVHDTGKVKVTLHDG